MMYKETVDKNFTIWRVGEVAQTGHMYVFDLDGTIADIEHRVHFIQNGKKDWDSFLGAVKDDTPKEWVIDIMRLLPIERVLIFSGRNEVAMNDTVEWLEKYNVPYSEMRMRWHHNFERDELLKPLMAKDYWERIRFIADDRQRVVDMWREKGFNVLQVEKWEEFDKTMNKVEGVKK